MHAMAVSCMAVLLAACCSAATALGNTLTVTSLDGAVAVSVDQDAAAIVQVAVGGVPFALTAWATIQGSRCVTRPPSSSSRMHTYRIPHVHCPCACQARSACRLRLIAEV